MLEDALQMIRVNCEGLITTTRVLLPFILKSKCGHIINIASTAADEAYSGGAIYCATKSFVEMFGDAIRIELIDKPVKVTTVKPGLVDTEFSTVRFKGDKEKADNVYKGLKNKMDSVISKYLKEVGMQYTAQDVAGKVQTYE